MKKIVKRSLIIVFLIVTFLAILSATYLSMQFFRYKNLQLDTSTLSNSNLTIELYDNENKKIEDNDNKMNQCCKINELNPYTKEAFISIEDKNFYKHKGINKKRILKAFINNLKSLSLKEGASTISQQLIKNTHLSNEKTLERKVKEIVLTKKLEKKFNKEQILESYLNIIFFGNNCYGLESASNYYFGKEAKDLTLEESCTLAGIIKSPSKYSPINHYDKCLQRRNLVISEMEKDKKITIQEKILAEQKPINLNITPRNSNGLNSYYESAIDESRKILNLPAKQIALSGYKIYTYLDNSKQNDLMESLKLNEVENTDNLGIVINSKTHGVNAYYGNSDYKLSNIKRQPASCIKPILVYGPALNEEVITPSTQILDEKIKIGDYQPSNVNKKFNGYVSITDSVKNSMNIPAIKVLSYIGIDTGKQYAEKMGLKFDENDNSYVLALGGMTYGLNLKDLTTAYTTFSNKGIYSESTFIKYITDKNGKLVYIHKPKENLVFREDSCYLMTNILQETAKTGTSKRLNDITNTEIASKTGTVGSKNKSGNTDAYNISYTPEETIGIWYGSLKNEQKNIAGGNQPTQVVKDYITKQTYKTKNFEIPSSIIEIEIDSLEKDKNHRIVIANSSTPKRYIEKSIFSRFNTPTDTSTNFLGAPTIKAQAQVISNQIILIIDTEKHIEYQIYKNDIPYQNINNKDGKIQIRINFNEKEAEIKIVAKYLDTSNAVTEEKIFNLSKQNNTMHKKNKKWYI